MLSTKRRREVCTPSFPLRSLSNPQCTWGRTFWKWLVCASFKLGEHLPQQAPQNMWPCKMLCKQRVHLSSKFRKNCMLESSFWICELNTLLLKALRNKRTTFSFAFPNIFEKVFFLNCLTFVHDAYYCSIRTQYEKCCSMSHKRVSEV